jgi:DNA-directed RNA polymerase subunit RPC12/RpoP
MEVKKWVNSINHLVTGNLEGLQVSENLAIPGAAVVAETLKDTFDIFKGAFIPKRVEVVSQKCIACGAQISGNKGQVINCEYCRARQQL